tara:strand:- start:174 stop:356 length:183 start_codon:yes stop_codon:yes gene_type:complete
MDKLKPTVESIELPANMGLLLLNILNVTSRRGAYIPEEFKSIGEVYEFIKTNLKLEEKES